MTIEELAKLSDEELLVRCAELCGWVFTPVTVCGSPGWRAEAPKVRGQLGDMYHYNISWRESSRMSIEFPNYPADLNAMHAAWMALSESEKVHFQERLQRAVLWTIDENTWLIAATARQRCIAFIAVKQQPVEVKGGGE
jgi:hypothetical protein